MEREVRREINVDYVLMMGSNCSGVGSQDFVTKTLHPDKKGLSRAAVRDFVRTNLYFFSVSLSLMTKSVASVIALIIFQF